MDNEQQISAVINILLLPHKILNKILKSLIKSFITEYLIIWSLIIEFNLTFEWPLARKREKDRKDVSRTNFFLRIVDIKA